MTGFSSLAIISVAEFVFSLSESVFSGISLIFLEKWTNQSRFVLIGYVDLQISRACMQQELIYNN